MSSMLRRLKASTSGFPSSASTRIYSKGLLGASNTSIHLIHRQHFLCIVRRNTKSCSHVQSNNTSSSQAVRRSLTTFQRTFQNHEEHAKTMSNKQNENEDAVNMLMMVDFPEGACLQDEEWLDTTTTINSSEQDCEKEQHLIMARIEKEIPLLVQDYLSVSVSSPSSTSLDDIKDEINCSFEGKPHHRHGNRSLAARYQKELKWVRKRMARTELNTNQQEQHVATTTSTTSTTSSSSVEEPPGNIEADERIQDANNRCRDSSFSVQGNVDDEGDDLYIDEEEDLKPGEAYLAESLESTTNNVRHIISPRWQQGRQENLTTTSKRSTSLLLLDSCLALLRAMSPNDWAVVDDQSLLLTDEDDGDQHCASQESQFDPDQSSTSNKGLQEEADDDDNSNDNIGLDDVDDELFWTLRQLKLGGVALGSTNDYNLVLARIALAAELDHDDIVEALYDTLHQIKAAAASAKTSIPSSSSSPSCEGNSGPNATTYEILLLIMVKRLGAFRSAIDLVRRDMIQTSSSSSSPFYTHLCTTATLEAAIQLCEMSGDLNLALELWRIAQSKNAAHDAVNMGDDDDSKDNDRTEVRITNRVHHSMLNMFKAVDARDEAIETLRICLQDNGRQINNGLDRVFANAINWPNRNRKGEPIDNLPVLVSILDLLDEETLYKPDLPILKQLLISVARGAQQENGRWKVVQRIFQKIVNSFPSFHIDEAIMSIGVEASEALSDSTLAAEMITRMLDCEFGDGSFGLMMTEISSRGIRQPQTLYAHNLSNRFVQHQQSRKSTRRLLSSKCILRAMDVCVNCGDAASARRILDCVETHYDAAQIPKAIRQRLFVSTLKVCAAAGQGQVAEQLLSAMRSSDVEPTEEAIGAVIHGYVLTKSSEKARGLWNDMKSGLFGVDIRPGPTSYNAIILDCIQNNSWSDALEIYDEMKKSRVVPLKSTYIGLLLSSFKEGGRRRTMQFIDELVQTKVSVNADICMMALRLLIPEIAKNTDFADMRSQLRSLSDKEQSVHELNHALRSAELEEQREPTKGLSQAKISERRVAAWHEVLKQLAKSSDALFRAEDGGENSA